MATKAIKLSNGTDDLLPITNAKVVQMTVDGTSKSVHDVIIENEEVTAAALNALNATKSDIEHTHDLSDLDISSLGLSYTAGSGIAIDDSSAGAININGGTDIYIANSGNTLTVNHKPLIGTGVTIGPAANSSKTLNPGDTFAVPRLSFSVTGHVNQQPSSITYTFPTILNYTASSATGASNASKGTSSPYLNLAVNGVVKSSHHFVGSGGVTVTKTAATTVSINGTTYTLSSSVSGGTETLTLTRGGASSGTTSIPLNLRYDIVNNNMDAITLI